MELIILFEEALFPHPPYSSDLPTAELNMFHFSNESMKTAVHRSALQNAMHQ
jgi:hypothetical protein